MDLITREGLGDLISDGYDLGIRFGEPRPSTLVVRRLLDTRVLTVASPGLKKHGHPTDPQQLVADRHRMIDFRDPETGRPFEWAFRKGRKEITVETQSQLMLSDVATMHAVPGRIWDRSSSRTRRGRPSLEWTTGDPISGLGGGTFPSVCLLSLAPIPRTEDAGVS